MAESLPAPMTVDEFLVWAEGRPGRFELNGGTVMAISPENVGHLTAKASAYDALRAAIVDAGVACHALPDGATVRVDVGTAYEPDAMVYCGPRLPRRAVEVPDPVIVVEVVSPSTGHDRCGEIVGYFAVPSLHHYLIVDAERRVLIHHARNGDEIATRILRGGALDFDPPGLVVRVEDLFGEPSEA